MTQIEQIRAEIERRRNILKPHGGQGMVVTEILRNHYADLLSFIESLEKDSAHEYDFANKGLDEAARLYAIPHCMKDIDKDYLDEYPYDAGLEAAFKAGAEWMAGQFQKIDGELVDWYETKGVNYCYGISTNESFEVPEGFYIKKK